MRSSLYQIVIVFVLINLGSISLRGRTRKPIAFRNVNVVDVAAGEIKRNVTVLTDRKTITSVGVSLKIPRNAEVIDATGKYLIPGLWDMHVHIVDPTYLALFVANGVLGVRDMGGNAAGPDDGCESISYQSLIDWRQEIRSGRRIGPQMILSGPVVSNTGSASSLNVQTPLEANAAVKKLKKLGVDFIKVYEKIPLEAYTSLAREAKAAGLTIAGHVPVDTVSLKEAASAGHRSVEHVRDHMLMCFTKDRRELLEFFRQDHWSEADIKWGTDRFEQCPDAIKAFRANRTWLVPTLVVERAKIAIEEPGFVDDPLREFLPASVQSGFDSYVAKKLAQTEKERKSERLWWITQNKVVARMRSEGIRFLAGTDSACEGGIPGSSLHEELRLLVNAGFTPLQALQTATLNPAKFFHRENDMGTIAKGKIANLVLLSEDPLEDISNTRKIEIVVNNGQLLRRKDLDHILNAVSAR